MKSEEEIAKTISVSLEGDVIRLELLEELSDKDDITRQAGLARDAVMRYLDANEDLEYCGLVNLLPLGMSAKYLTDDAKKIYIELVSLVRMHRMAFVVPSKFAQMLTGFFAQMSHKWGKTKWFTNEKEARAWLGERH